MRLPVPVVLGAAVVAALGAAGLVRGAVPQGGPAGPAITVTGAYARASAPPTDQAAAYFTVHNDGGTADKLVSVDSDAGAMTMLHKEVAQRMVALPDGVKIAPHSSLTLSTGGYHVMIEQLHGGRLDAGQTVHLTLTFAHAGTVQVSAPVIGLAAPAPTAGGSASPSG